MKRLLPLMMAAFALAAGPVKAAEPALGKAAPAFSLKDVDGKSRSLAEFKGKTVVLEWINHGCPFVKKHYESGNMQGLQKELAAQGVVWLSICSSAKGKQGDLTAAEWKAANAEKGAAPTAVLLDPKGEVGKLYGAKTTPHMYVVDAAGNLAYKGAIDDKPTADKADVAGAKNYVRQAVTELLAGKAVSEPSTTSYGCSVKYE
jgi:peroxiredoxin